MWKIKAFNNCKYLSDFLLSLQISNNGLSLCYIKKDIFKIWQFNSYRSKSLQK